MPNCTYMLMLIAFLISSTAIAGNYEVSVTRKGSNLYRMEGENIFINTAYCYEYAYSESSYLKMRGYRGEIIFLDSGGKCDVRGVYGASDQQAGKYSVRVTREGDDWYELAGQGIFIKTSGCLNLALGREAILNINSDGYGTLYIDRDRCQVEGLFSKMSL